MRSIGIVLSNTPAYSETFFVSLIKGLSANNYKIIIFAKKTGHFMDWLPAGVEVVEPYSVARNRFIQLLKTAVVVSCSYVLHHGETKKIIELDKEDGFDRNQIVRRIYLNAHIIGYKLNYLYFGFAALGVDRENVAQAIGAKSVLSFRGYDITTYPIQHPGCYDLLFRKIDKVHSISDDLYAEALGYGLSGDKSYMKINPAIDTELFCKYRQVRDILSKPKIISVGRLTWNKGYDYAIEALSKLPFDFDFTIIGDGSDNERLLFAAYQFGILDKVHLLGRKSHDEIVGYMKEADLYIQPSVQEGFCNAVLEAQASGLICIVSDAGGLSENVENGVSGIVVPKRDANALANAIMEVCNSSKDSRQTMSDNAVDRVREKFSVSDQIKQFIKLFD